ncbi:MAG: NRDE family protein [Steroidobacteraceae bacterium]
MCLLVVAWKSHPRYRLVVAANRDEFHERPAAPLGWWNDDARVLAGRDLQAGGAWLGVSRSGRFGAVTNFRELERASAPDAPSRGRLVPDFLAADVPPEQFVAATAGAADRYAGFNLLLASPDALLYFSNRAAEPARALAPGVYGLSNHWLDSPWPKLVRVRGKFAAVIGSGDAEAAPLFDLLADRDPAPGDAMPATGLPPDLEQALSSPFVMHEQYGTRCSTVVLVGHDGRTTVAERRFDAAGSQTGATRLEFACAA